MNLLRGWHLGILLLCHFGFVYLVSSLSSIFIEGSNLVKPTSIKSIETNFIWWLYIVQWVIAPIKEELKYRLSLGDVNLFRIKVSLSIFVSDILISLFYFSVLVEVDTYNLLYYLLLGFLSVLVFYFLRNDRFNNVDEKLVKFYSENQKYLIVGSIILFAVWHCLTYISYYDMPLITLFLIHLISASFFTFVRLRSNIQLAIIYHFMYNLPIMILYTLAYLSSQPNVIK